MDLPDIEGRKAILKVHAAGKPLAPEVTFDSLAKETPGFSGAELSNLINEAAIMAARGNKKSIFMDDFEEAVDRVIAGPKKKGRRINPREKEMTAYHEAGHALVAWGLEFADPVHKISIVARGQMGGHTSLVPEEDRYLWTKNQFEHRMAVTMGGRVAEQIIFNEVTTGASNDLEQATKLAKGMIKQYGMFSAKSYEEMPISEVFQKARAGEISVIEVYGNDLLIILTDGAEFRSRKEDDFQLAEFSDSLIEKGLPPITIDVKVSHSLDGLGAPRTFGKIQEMVFLGRDMGQEEKDYGDKIGEEIDHAISVLMNEAYEQAVSTITTHQSKLVRLAEYLIEHETVSGEAMNRLFNADDESSGETAIPPVSPETPPAYNANPSPATHPQPSTPQPAPTLPSTSTEGD
jgi:ATP-dependent Zn protease